MSNEQRKIICEPGYYEIKVRYAEPDEQGQYVIGAAGFFKNNNNCTLFDDFKSFVDYFAKQEFDDSICFHKDLIELVEDMLDIDRNDMRLENDYYV